MKKSVKRLMEGLGEVSSRWTVIESYSVILQPGVSSACMGRQGVWQG